MKGLCISSSNGECTLSFDGETPKEGMYYTLEDSVNGTQAQNKAFHSLVMEYFISGMHSYNVDNFDDFRNQIKKKLGQGFESFVFVEVVNDKPVIKDCAKYEDIPLYIREDPELRNLARGRLKSWSQYSKKQRKTTIDNVISEMLQAGVNTKKFQEILSGMEA